MFRMRLKSPSVTSEWRCCFCLHVRTATIILGIWHLILHVLVLSAIAVIFRNYNMLDDARVGNDFREKNNQYDDNTIENLPTPLSKVDPSIPQRYHRDHQLYYNDLDMAGLVTMFTLTFNLLLVYGALKGKATPLLPFFCLQLFDFAVSSLTATSYACYMRSMHRLVAETWQLPFRSYLLQLSPQCLSFIVLLVFLASMILKAYSINIVWRCYKYLTLRQQAIRTNGISLGHYIMPSDIPTERIPPMEPDYSSLLPDYEAACKQMPPPSYQAAVAAQQSILASIQNSSNETTTPEVTPNVAEATPTTPESAPKSPVSSPTITTFPNQVTTITIPQSANATDAVAPVEEQQQPK